MVQTNEFEGCPASRARDGTLEEKDGKTLLTAVALFPSVEDRDMNVANGMEGGARETYQRLEEVIQSLASRCNRSRGHASDASWRIAKRRRV